MATVKEIKSMRAELAELVDCATREYSEYSTEMAMAGNYGIESMGEYVADYLLNRNVVILPYKINLPEVMYRYMFDNNEKAVVVECKVGKNTGTGFTLVHYDGREWNYRYEDIGKCVYYTKEEVEKYIEEAGLNKTQ